MPPGGQAAPQPPQPTPPVPGAATAPPVGTQRLARILPTGDIDAAIEARNPQTLSRILQAKPVKGVVAAIDPQLVAANALERLPLVWRSMEDTARQITKQAMTYMQDSFDKVKGVEVKDMYFTKGVSVKPQYAGQGFTLAWGDVAEHPYRYDMPQELRDTIKLANELTDERLADAQAAGAKFKQRKYEPGGHWFGRIVEEVRDVVSRRRTDPGMTRYYDSMEGGIQATVKYSDDFLATFEAGIDWIGRKEIASRMYDEVKVLGKTPTELIDQSLTRNALKTAKDLKVVNEYERVLAGMRRGNHPYQKLKGQNAPSTILMPSVRKIEQQAPGTAQRVENAWKSTNPAQKMAAIDTLIADATTLSKQAYTDFKAAKSARGSAIKKLQSTDWAEGAKFGLPPGRIGVGRLEMPFGQGRLFPRDVSDYLNKQFDKQGSQLLTTLNSVSAAGRVLQAGFDLSTAAIQLLPALAVHPKAWARATGAMFRALWDAKPYHAYMARADTQDVLKELLPHGLTIDTPDYGEALQQGGLIKAGVERLPGATRKVGEAITGRAENVFQAPLNVAKIEMAKGLLPLARQQGQLKELAGFLNNVTGTQSLLGQGLGVNQRLAEGALVFFSPRYTRASFALINQALTGGIGGAEARKALAGLVVSYIALAYGINLAQGHEPHEGFFDPTSSYFLSADLFGRRVGFGGVWRSMVTTLGMAVKDGSQDPSIFVSADRKEQPVLRFLSGRTSPLTGLLWDAAVERDFMGEPLQNVGQVARRVARLAQPMWLQEFVPQEGQEPQQAASLIPDVMGLRALPRTTAMRRDELIAKYTGEANKGWADLNTIERWKLTKEHPDVEALVQQGLTERARRGDVVGEFWTSVQAKREPIFAEIQALTDQLNQKKITGQQYRDGVRQKEMLIAQMPELTKRGDARYAEVPLTDAEKQTYYKTAPPKQDPVDQFLNQYYDLTQQFIDPATGMADVAKLVQARDELKAKSDPGIVRQVMEYVNRNRDPEYVNALNVFAQYKAVPQYRGWSTEQIANVNKAISLVASIRKTLPAGLSNATPQAMARAIKENPDMKQWILLIPQAAKRRNPARKTFWAKNAAVLDKYFAA